MKKFYRSKLVISHLGSDKSDEEHSRLESDTKWLKNALTGWIVLWTLWTFGSLCWLLSCLNIVILFHRTPSGNNNNNALKLYKVPPRFELGSLDSKCRVLTITPLHHGTLLEHTLLKNGLHFVQKGSWTSIFCFILLTLWEFSRVLTYIYGGAFLFSPPTKLKKTKYIYL